MNTAQISLFGAEEEVIVHKKRLKKENTDKKIIEAKDKEIEKLKAKIQELESKDKKMSEIDYVAVENSHCENKKLFICYRDLETITEMCWDYVEILKSKLPDIDDNKPYKKALYKLKINQISNIGNKIATEIKYNKSCSNASRDDDIGGDALELLVNGFEH